MPNELKLMQDQAQKLDVEVLKYGFDKFARIELDLKYSVNPQNLFEAVCISLVGVKLPQKNDVISNQYVAMAPVCEQKNSELNTKSIESKPNIEINLKKYMISVPVGTTITDIAPKDQYLGDVYINGMKNNLLKEEKNV